MDFFIPISDEHNTWTKIIDLYKNRNYQLIRIRITYKKTWKWSGIFLDVMNSHIQSNNVLTMCYYGVTDFQTDNRFEEGWIIRIGIYIS